MLVDVLAIGYGVSAFADLPSLRGLDVVVGLSLSALIAVEGARRVESRRRPGGPLHKDLAPAWMIAAAIVLHPAMAILVAVLLRTWWRIRAGRCIPYRSLKRVATPRGRAVTMPWNLPLSPAGNNLSSSKAWTR